MTKEEIEKEEEVEKALEESDNEVLDNNSEEWKVNFVQNPNMSDYGNKDAEVIDYGMFNLKGMPINTYDNSEVVLLKSKIKFNKTVKDPIFTMTVKDFQGNDIAGTNTDIEKVLTGTYKKGDVVVVEFKQRLPISPGKYTLSFSCTQYDLGGNLVALNRKYDALLIEVMTTKHTVGLMRIDSEITITKLGDKK